MGDTLRFCHWCKGHEPPTKDLADDELQDLAEDYGMVADVRIWQTQAWKTGIVGYTREEDLEKAIEEMDNRMMQYRHLYLRAYAI